MILPVATVTHVCAVCDEQFEVDEHYPHQRRTCSIECRDEWRGREKEVYLLSDREKEALGHGVCPICGEEFGTAHAVKSHAPAKHGLKVSHQKHTCDACGDEFTRLGWLNSDLDRVFCSKSCSIKETMRSVSGEDHPMWGRRGPDSPAFKHGLSALDGATIGQKVRGAMPGHWQTISEEEREGSSCVSCGSEEDLHTHHIIPLLAGGTHGEWNRLVLCHSCHKKAEAKTSEIVDYHLVPDGFCYDKWN